MEKNKESKRVFLFILLMISVIVSFTWDYKNLEIKEWVLVCASFLATTIGICTSEKRGITPMILLALAYCFIAFFYADDKHILANWGVVLLFGGFALDCEFDKQHAVGTFILLALTASLITFF